jgi:hypothetical protein
MMSPMFISKFVNKCYSKSKSQRPNVYLNVKLLMHLFTSTLFQAGLGKNIIIGNILQYIFNLNLIVICIAI